MFVFWTILVGWKQYAATVIWKIRRSASAAGHIILVDDKSGALRVRILKNSIVSRLYRTGIFRISCWQNIGFSGRIFTRVSISQFVDLVIIYRLSCTLAQRRRHSTWLQTISEFRYRDWNKITMSSHLSYLTLSACGTIVSPSLQLLLQNDKAQNLHTSSRTWSRHLHKCQQVTWKMQRGWCSKNTTEREKKSKFHDRQS